jgi:FdhD protein
MNKTANPTPIRVFSAGQQYDDQLSLIVEEPLSIRIQGEPYVVVMRTPGEEINHAAGFCLAEGLIDVPDDIATIGFCSETEVNVVTITLTDSRRDKVADLLERKGFVSQTSCGICGKQVVQEMLQVMQPLKDDPGNPIQFPADRIMDRVNQFSDHQPLHQQTRSAHAAMLFDGHLTRLTVAEDVGRHNALDKAIGRVFMEKQLDVAQLGIMSSRLSYELVQKAARARLTVLVGISRPTALAVELAVSLNMTLACVRQDRLMVFCSPKRIIGAVT